MPGSRLAGPMVATIRARLARVMGVPFANPGGTVPV